MTVEERVSRLEGENVGMNARIDDLRADMNFRFNIVFGMLIALLGMVATLTGIVLTVLLRGI